MARALAADLSRTVADTGSQPTAPSPAELASHFPAYEFEALLGAGGMGAVYRARHRQLERTVAIKILRPELRNDPAFVERFLREARTLASLDHPHIVGVHDFGEAGGYCFLVLEHVEGANLRELLQQGRLGPKDALALVPQLCDALQHAHDHGVVHRDIKPENILIDQEGHLRIADFGLVKLLGGQGASLGLTESRDALGTPLYMAPEQIAGSTTLDHRADIYSLGVVVYEMLTGELPIGRFAPPSAKVPGSEPFDAVVLRSLESDPAKRYQQARDVKSELQGERRVQQQGPTEGMPARLSSRLQESLATWIPLGVVLGLACLAYGTNPAHSPDRDFAMLSSPALPVALLRWLRSRGVAGATGWILGLAILGFVLVLVGYALPALTRHFDADVAVASLAVLACFTFWVVQELRRCLPGARRAAA